MKLFQQLQNVGAVVRTELVKKSVTMPNGEVIEVHIREIPEAEIGAIFKSDDGKARMRLIHAGLRDPDGSIAISLQDAGRLNPLAAAALQRAIIEVSGGSPTAGFEGNSESEETSGSGTSSPSALDEPSQS